MEGSNFKLTFLNKKAETLGEAYVDSLDDVNNPVICDIPKETKVINVYDRNGKLINQMICGNRDKIIDILNSRGQNTESFEKNRNEYDGALFVYNCAGNSVVRVER